MKRKIILCLLPVLLLLWVVSSIPVLAEAGDVPESSEAYEDGRNIYVGDIITLKITSLEFSAEELKEIFQGFEIVEIKNEPDGYLLSLRTFETGEQKIILGNKEIVINVQSTLNDIDREGIFEGSTAVIEPGFSFNWRILFYVAAGAFALSGCVFLIKVIQKRKIKSLSPHRLFLMRSGALSAEDNNYFVDLTFYFKEYIGSVYKCRIIGKTSTEIVSELKNIQALNSMLPEIKKWLTECDRFKFTGIKASKDVKQAHYGELLKLVENIDMHSQREGVS